MWMIAPGQRDEQKEILFDRDYEDAYSDPGSPALRRTSRSTYVIARLEGTGQLIMQGVTCLSYLCFKLALCPICRAVTAVLQLAYSTATDSMPGFGNRLM